MRSHLPLLALLVLPACRGVGTTALGPDTSAEPFSLGETPKPPPQASLVPHGARVGADPGHAGRGTPLTPRPGNELAAFAAGCFWGVEETFRQVPGVVATAVGYSGGHTDDPTYETVCSHGTGHAETVLVEFDPKVVSYATLLNVFFKNHDPTTKDRQGPDVGDQYRSAVFTFSPAQATAAGAAKQREGRALGRPVVTIVEPVGRFWKAEEYHQQYDEKTGTRSCPLPRGLSVQDTSQAL
jgi:peptide-methionine (S)-S-oxide reductase